MRLAIFVSGSGTNLQCIIDAIKSKKITNTDIFCVIADRPCFALQRAEKEGVKNYLFKRNSQLSHKIDQVIDEEVDLIVLAGFLSILSERFTKKWDKKMINIHPSLLPKFGGKGMFGEHVHKAVLEAKETQSGATVHYVTHEIDEGEIILQQSFPVAPTDTINDLEDKVRKVEHSILVEAIQKIQARIE